MATKITKTGKRKDYDDESKLSMQGLDPDEALQVVLDYHNTGIQWDRAARTLTIEVREFSNGHKVGDDEPLIVTPEVQPQKPPEDVLDPETDEVIIAAGSEQAEIPVLADVMNLPLPPAMRVAPTTYGEIARLMIKANDRLLRHFRPEYNAGDNVEDDL